MVTLGGLGYGMSTTGDEAIEWIDYELWATGGPVGLAPGGVGDVDNPIGNAHTVSRRLETREDVGAAQPLAFQTFLGVPTVAMHLSELQEVSGTTGTDPGAIIALDLVPATDRTAVQRDLERLPGPRRAHHRPAGPGRHRADHRILSTRRDTGVAARRRPLSLTAMGVWGAFVAGRRVARISPLAHLR